MKKRKSYSNEYKARIALEAIKGEKTINEIASEYKVHSNMITKWKKHLLENMAAAFDRSSSEKSDDTEKEELYKQIGKMKVELDWLKKKVGFAG
jgi:transposase-like protein